MVVASGGSERLPFVLWELKKAKELTGLGQTLGHVVRRLDWGLPGPQGSELSSRSRALCAVQASEIRLLAHPAGDLAAAASGANGLCSLPQPVSGNEV